jgi:mannose-6-phosphate isomerase
MQAEEFKTTVFKQVEDLLETTGFPIASKDSTRPWGGFFVIDEGHSNQFAQEYFGLSADSLKIAGKLSPKILIVAPWKRLSWQYHHRRAEVWKVLKGTVGVVTSETDSEGECKNYNPGDVVTLKQGERHRLVGLDDWGVLAEIWQHTDAKNPSDENDIVRVQDDFGRGDK